jgi:hypothetical protein
MALSSTLPPSVLDRLSARLILLWAGLSVGVAFLATPVKFLAPSLTLPAALDVGRHTFSLYNRAELALLVALILLASGPGCANGGISRYSARVVSFGPRRCGCSCVDARVADPRRSDAAA